MSGEAHAISRREVLALGAWSALGMAGLLATRQTPPALAASAAESITRPIPSSGERIPIVGIGTARRFDVAETADARAPLREVLRELPRRGGTLVDTAPSYGAAERVVGDLVAELGNRDALFIATKVGRGSADVAAGLAEMRQSLDRLRMAKVDLLQIHNLAGVDQMLPVLRDWKRKGRIRYIGITTSFPRQHEPLAQVMEREGLDFIQIDYAIDNRAVEARLLPLAADRGIAVLTNLPFGRGRVFQAFGDRAIPGWAADLGITSWAQFALKYVVSHPAVTCAIPGTSRLAHLEDNLGAARGSLPDEATRKRMVALLESA